MNNLLGLGFTRGELLFLCTEIKRDNLRIFGGFDEEGSPMEVTLAMLPSVSSSSYGGVVCGVAYITAFGRCSCATVRASCLLQELFLLLSAFDR